MSLLSIAIVGLTVAVVAALFVILWRERSSPRTALVAVVSGAVLATWAVITGVLAYRGVFVARNAESVPAVGIALILSLAGLTVALIGSPLRSLLTNQRNLVLINLWRLMGIVFLVLMWQGRLPALWALPAGIGDIIVGGAAPWVANQLAAPHGRRRAIVFHLFGMADLVVAIGLGIMTSLGPAQVFHTTPTAELLAQFPMVLVPTFLVPLAFMLHVVSLWHLVAEPFDVPSSPHANRFGDREERASVARQ